MKVAIYSESDADEAALRVLVNALLGQQTEAVPLPWLRSRGWPSVKQTVSKVIQYLYYRTDVDGLVVVADADDSNVHAPEHDAPGAAVADCRLCELRREATQTVSMLPPLHGRCLLKIAIGLAVPAIEAWLRCGHDVHVTETAWVRARQSRQRPFTQSALKRAVYGSERPSLEQQRRRMLEEATRLATDLTRLESSFPNGFGPLARELMRWIAVNP